MVRIRKVQVMIGDHSYYLRDLAKTVDGDQITQIVKTEDDFIQVWGFPIREDKQSFISLLSVIPINRNVIVDYFPNSSGEKYLKDNYDQREDFFNRCPWAEDILTREKPKLDSDYDKVNFDGHSEESHDSDCSTHNMPAYSNGDCDCSVSELGVIEKVDSMCVQSLDPETMDKWEDVKNVLNHTRSKLKDEKLPKRVLIDEYEFDTLASFLELGTTFIPKEKFDKNEIAILNKIHNRLEKQFREGY